MPFVFLAVPTAAPPPRPRVRPSFAASTAAQSFNAPSPRSPMSSIPQLRMSRRIVAGALHLSLNTSACPATARSGLRFNGPSLSVRYASTTVPSKTIELEQPDKFRPPSHPQRLSRRAPRQYPGPPLSQSERESQKTRRYPHMFPNPGTFMYWFLTNRTLHLCITMGTLSLLAVITFIQHFLKTSPFAHLIPPIHTVPFHPIHYFSECVSVFRMHTEYTSDITAEMRQHQVLDAQKQRLYRRAHGLEDLDLEEEHGVDVRGLVPWDDGLTKKERAVGGRDPNLTLKMIHEVKTRDADGNMVYVRDLAKKEYIKDEKGRIIHIPLVEGQSVLDVVTGQSVVGEDGEAKPAKRKVKRWFGIWE